MKISKFQRLFNIKSIHNFARKMSNSKNINIVDRKEHIVLTETQFRDEQIIDATILQIQAVSPTVKALTLDVQNKPSTRIFKSGQWVDFFIPGLSHVGGYSIYSTPKKFLKDSMIDLAVKCSDWPPAKWIHEEAKAGLPVQIRIGGDFHYPNQIAERFPHHNILLIAGGIGINPIFSIMQCFHEENSDGKLQSNRLELLYSAKTEEELVFRDEISELCKSNKRILTNFFVTEQSHQRKSINNLAYQRISDSDIEKSVTRLKEHSVLVYICGPKSLIEYSNEILLNNLNIPKEQIFFELWY